MNLNLKGKNAIITGGSHGIGLATAKMLASEGCNVAILSRSKERLQSAKKDILKVNNIECLTIQVDVLSREQIEKSFKKISENWNNIHILVNNVGGGGRWGIWLAEILRGGGGR